MSLPELTTTDRARYEWQMWTPGVGEAGQRRLKDASVLISRCGGVGGSVALELAAAGVGRLIIAHAGDIKPSDLNRQLLMTDDAIGTSRAGSIRRRLAEFNPHVAVEVVPENINEDNVDGLVARAGHWWMRPCMISRSS
jgi:molybdopterin/thiamine biosynthesis adenylyltransferase